LLRLSSAGVSTVHSRASSIEREQARLQEGALPVRVQAAAIWFSPLSLPFAGPGNSCNAVAFGLYGLTLGPPTFFTRKAADRQALSRTNSARGGSGPAWRATGCTGRLSQSGVPFDDWRYVADRTICLIARLMSPPLAWKSRASQSSNRDAWPGAERTEIVGGLDGCLTEVEHPQAIDEDT